MGGWPACSLLALATLPGAAYAQATAPAKPPRLVHVQALTPTAQLGLVPGTIAIADAGLVAAQSQFDQIKARLAALRSGSGRHTSGVADTGIRPPTGPGSTALAFAPATAQATVEGGDDGGGAGSRLGFFASATFSNGDRDPGVATPGSDYDANGLIVGLDYRMSDRWILGGTFAWNREDMDLDGTQGNIDADSWSVGAYSTYYVQDSWYVDSVASYGHNQYDLRRTAGTQTFRGDMDGHNLNLAATVGRDFNRGAWAFGPYGRLLYTRLTFDDFTEEVSGAGPATPQTISTRDFTQFSSVLGGKLSYNHSTDWGVFAPMVQAEWQHEFDDDPAVVAVSAAGVPGTPLVFTGDPTDTDFYRIGVGASFIMTRGRSGFIYYERVLGRDEYSQGSLALGLRIEF
jgi:outer membrane autotransporter protein